MRKLGVLVVVAAVFLLTVSAFAAPAAPATPGVRDLDAIDETSNAAYHEGKYGFCQNPPPLTPRQAEMCPLALEAQDCEGLIKRCGGTPTAKEESSFERFVKFFGPILRALLYVLVVGIIIAIAIPVARALAKLRRDRKIVPKAERVNEQANRGTAVIPDHHAAIAEISDAETALALADEHRERGDFDRALGLYLAASLAALDRRGAIRVARHRTNGEYVRACTEAESKPALREIVREVDHTFFGGAKASSEGALRAGERAKAIVLRVTTLALVLLMFAGCNHLPKGTDPAGDELPLEVLRRNGYSVGHLGSSLATMPVPENDEGAPVVIIDVERVPLEEETQAHLMRWVEGGGALVLFGDPNQWPREIRRKPEAASSRDLVVKAPDPNGGLVDIDEEEDDEDESSPSHHQGYKFGMPIVVEGARVARSDSFTWKDAEGIAFVGDRTYAAKKRIGKGLVLGVANDDLFTNVGMRVRRNPAALVTLVRSISHDLRRPVSVKSSSNESPQKLKIKPTTLGEVRIAKAQDGIPPPANPFAALVAAGLGKGAWHALAAAILLFLAYGIRHSRPKPAPAQARRAFAEHVEATGAFYGRAKAHAHALSAYGKYVELRLREILPRGADPIAFLATRTGITTERATELYTRATQAKSTDDLRGDELMVIEELRRLMSKLA